MNAQYKSVKLTSHEMSRLKNAFDRAFMKIFGTFDKTIIRQCQFYLGVLPLCYEIDYRTIKFLKNLFPTGIDDVISSSINRDLCKKYGVLKNDNDRCVYAKVWRAFACHIFAVNTLAT